MTSKPDKITFKRLTTVPPATLVEHMNDPRIAAHMPLLTGPWNEQAALDFVSAKETCWQRDGLGHWAIYVAGTYAGWGGFQKEGDVWDFGLVLTADAFGLGLTITQKAIAFAKADDRIPFITFLLPPSRTKLAALKRLGAELTGEISLQGYPFNQYRMDTLAP